MWVFITMSAVALAFIQAMLGWRQSVMHMKERVRLVARIHAGENTQAYRAERAVELSHMFQRPGEPPVSRPVGKRIKLSQDELAQLESEMN
jgi:hypothetical protein